MASPAKRTTRRYTLAFDVGGSNVKAGVLGKNGDLVSEHPKVETPERFTPSVLLKLLVRMAADVPRFDRVAVGIPGIVHRDVVYSLPASGSRAFKRYELGRALADALDRPVRVTNDATMHGLATIRGTGVEMVITLGTGLGTALFIDGTVNAHHQTLPHEDEPFGSSYGDEARRRIGTRRWRKRVKELFGTLRDITNYDHLYVGGGNAGRLKGELPRHITRIDNVAGLLGGHRLWEWGEVP